jgi:hypothetical protein
VKSLDIHASRVMDVMIASPVFVVYTACRRLAHTGTEFTVEGLEHVPASGPVLIVARHFHHLYDGCILLIIFPEAYLNIDPVYTPKSGQESFLPFRNLDTRQIQMVH